MIKILYQEYYSDLMCQEKTKTFYSLNALKDWIFQQMVQPYDRKFAMFFPLPKTMERIARTGPCSIELCTGSSSGLIIRIDQIENEIGIIFSDGKHTSGEKYWNEEIKGWLEECEKFRIHPSFKFA